MTYTAPVQLMNPKSNTVKMKNNTQSSLHPQEALLMQTKHASY